MSRRTILVVDDEPQIRGLIRSLLGGADYEILEAGDGLEAVLLCESEKPELDLLLTDIVMPGLDGIRLAEELAVRYPSLRVLFMTGQCDVESVERHCRVHGYGAVAKPFDLAALARAVREAFYPAPGGDDTDKRRTE